MKLLMLVPLGIVTNIACLALVQALPTWQSFNSWSSIDSLITGSTSLLAGGLEYGIPYYLTTPGSSGARQWSIALYLVLLTQTKTRLEI